MNSAIEIRHTIPAAKERRTARCGRFNPRRLAAFCLAALALYGAADSSAFAQGNVETIKDIEVGLSGDRMMHVEIRRPAVPPQHPMPVVFMMHSGGWKDGTYHNCFGRGSLWTKGYTIVSIEYHPAGPDARWPVQLLDCLRAVRWMRTNAAKYNVDPKRFAVSGESAGAHLAACVAVYGDDPKYADKDFPDVSAAVQAAVIGSGPLDILSSRRNHTDQKLKWNVENLIGGGPERNPEGWNEACMVLHVTGKLPPFFIWHGEKDDVIPIDEANHFVEALKTEGVPFEFILVKNGGHDALRPVQKDAPLEPDGATVLKRMTAFLDTYLRQPEAHAP